MMPIQKRPLSKLKLGVLYSLSESYMMLPFLIFSSLLTEKSTTVNFFVPVIIVYSVLRACLIALRGFGQITNPYRILKGGLLIVLSGSILMLMSFFYRPLLMLSALLKILRLKMLYMGCGEKLFSRYVHSDLCRCDRTEPFPEKRKKYRYRSLSAGHADGTCAWKNLPSGRSCPVSSVHCLCVVDSHSF